jgi:hypothetical protein
MDAHIHLIYADQSVTMMLVRTDVMCTAIEGIGHGDQATPTGYAPGGGGVPPEAGSDAGALEIPRQGPPGIHASAATSATPGTTSTPGSTSSTPTNLRPSDPSPYMATVTDSHTGHRRPGSPDQGIST